MYVCLFAHYVAGDVSLWPLDAGSDEFEPVTITEYSKAPELPDVMKPQAPPATSKPE